MTETETLDALKAAAVEYEAAGSVEYRDDLDKRIATLAVKWRLHRAARVYARTVREAQHG